MPNGPAGDRGHRRISLTPLKLRAEEARSLLEARRRRNAFVDMGFRAAELHNRSGGGLLAGAIAFRFFMFIVPFAFVLVMGLGMGSDATDTDPRDVARRAGITGLAATAMKAGADASTLTQWVTLGIAFVALMLGARNLMKALTIAHALIWKTRPQRLPHATRTGLVFIGVFALGLALADAVSAVRKVSFIAWVFALALYTLIPTAVWLVCSQRVFPRRPGVTWTDVWPGALMFGVGTQALHVVTVTWVTYSFESKTETYGALGAALTILLWAYLLGWLVTSSAAFNAARWRRVHPMEHPVSRREPATTADDVAVPFGAGTRH